MSLDPNGGQGSNNVFPRVRHVCDFLDDDDDDDDRGN